VQSIGERKTRERERDHECLTDRLDVTMGRRNAVGRDECFFFIKKKGGNSRTSKTMQCVGKGD